MIARVAQALNRKDGDKGFTLVELLVVIIIIGILAAIAIPVFLNQRNKGYDAAVKSDLKNAALVAETNYVDNLTYVNEHTFVEGGSAGTTSLASKNTRYAATTTAQGYIIYGLSQSGKVFVLDSAAGGTPEPATAAQRTAAAAVTDNGATGTQHTWGPSTAAWPTS